MSAASQPNVVLVHGGFVDGSGWQGVHNLLVKDGFTVSIVQNPTLSLEGDVAATSHPDAQDGPVVLVGHSYGGAVITEAGTHDNVAALVYIAAFAPDKGESVNTLIADPPPGAPVPPILPPRDGFLFLDREKFHDSFAADLSAEQAAFMADSQVPWGVGALGGSITEPAWRIKPSWYLVATDDRMIPPPAQRAMSERAGSTVAEAAAATPSTCPSPTRSRTSSGKLRQHDISPPSTRSNGSRAIAYMSGCQGDGFCGVGSGAPERHPNRDSSTWPHGASAHRTFRGDRTATSVPGRWPQ